MTSAPQLPLFPDLPGLPPIALPADWKEQPRGWGHPFHPLATWLGALPPAMAHALIERFSRPGDVVLDPFCGRGTVPLQAILRRRTGVGVDLHPVAALLSGAVLEPPTRRELETRIAHLRIEWTHAAGAARDEAAALLAGSDLAATPFHPRTLAELLFLRRRLDRADRVDRFLLATLVGILHGARPSFLSDAMPNALGILPAPARAGTSERPRREVFPLLERRVARLYRSGLPVGRGIAIEGDARSSATAVRDALRARALPDRVRLVIANPPDLRVTRHGHASWLRLWLLGEDPGRVEAALASPASRGASAALLGAVLADLRPLLTHDATVVLVLGTAERGSRRSGTVDAAAEAWSVAEPLGYRIAGVTDDPVLPGRSPARIRGGTAGSEARHDRILVLAAGDAGVARARAAASLPVDWTPAVSADTWLPAPVRGSEVPRTGGRRPAPVAPAGTPALPALPRSAGS